MVDDLAIDQGAVVVIHLGLCCASDISSTRVRAVAEPYLEPFSIGTIYRLDQLGVVYVEEVGTQADDRAVFLVKLLDCQLVVFSSLDQEEPPEICPSCWEMCQRAYSMFLPSMCMS